MKLRELGLALLAFVALTAWQLYPAWWSPAHGIVGDWRHPDTISNVWLYQWTATQLLSGGSILHNAEYYVPIGDAPWLAGNGSDAVPATLFSALGFPRAVLAWVFATLVINGFGGLVLARRFGASPAAATITGAALVMFPYVDVELGGARYAQLPIGQVAFFVAAWFDLLDREGARPTLRAVATGVLYGLVSFTYWYHGVWAALFGAIAFAFRPKWPVVLPFLAGALVTVGPPLWIFLDGWAQIPGTSEDSFPNALAIESSLPPWFFLLGRPGFWGRVVLPAVMWAPLLLLFVPGRAPLRWDHRAAAVAAALFWALCLGPWVSWMGGTEGAVPGPFWIYGLAAPLRRFWWPYRHVVGLGIALIPLAALGIDRLLGWISGFADPVMRRWVPMGAVVAAVVSMPQEIRARDGIVAAPVSRWEAPAVYESIRALPGDALLQLPITPKRVTGQQALSYQWVHQKRMLNGHAMWVDRVRPDAWDTQVAGMPLLVALGALERGEATELPPDVAALTALGVRWIVLDASNFPGTLAPLPAHYRSALTALFGAPTVDADGVAAWDVTAVGRTAVPVPAIDLPPLAEGEEGEVPDYGDTDPLGWDTWLRTIPPITQ